MGISRDIPLLFNGRIHLPHPPTWRVGASNLVTDASVIHILATDGRNKGSKEVEPGDKRRANRARSPPTAEAAMRAGRGSLASNAARRADDRINVRSGQPREAAEGRKILSALTPRSASYPRSARDGNLPNWS
jgi:hypothetical protein